MTTAQVILSVLTLIASVTGAVTGAVLVGRSNAKATDQREQQARREEWWRRFTWAIGLLSEDTPFQQEVGMEIILHLAGSLLAGTDESKIIRRVSTSVFQHARAHRPIVDGVDSVEPPEGGKG